MKCPICKKEMENYFQDVSYRDDGKRYERKYFNCKTDDAWAITEIPADKNLA